MSTEEFQLERFKEIKVAIKEEIESLRETTQGGFDSLLHELRLSREQGHIPVSVMEKILQQNHDAYRDIIKTSNEAHRESATSTTESNRKVMNTLCYVVAALLAWVTGIKYFEPGTSKQASVQAENASITVQQAPAESQGLNQK